MERKSAYTCLCEFVQKLGSSLLKIGLEILVIPISGVAILLGYALFAPLLTHLFAFLNYPEFVENKFYTTEGFNYYWFFGMTGYVSLLILSMIFSVFLSFKSKIKKCHVMVFSWLNLKLHNKRLLIGSVVCTIFCIVTQLNDTGGVIRFVQWEVSSITLYFYSSLNFILYTAIHHVILRFLKNPTLKMKVFCAILCVIISPAISWIVGKIIWVPFLNWII